MTKSELIDAVARRSKITKSRAEQVVNCIFETMTASPTPAKAAKSRRSPASSSVTTCS